MVHHSLGEEVAGVGGSAHEEHRDGLSGGSGDGVKEGQTAHHEGHHRAAQRARSSAVSVCGIACVELIAGGDGAKSLGEQLIEESQGEVARHREESAAAGAVQTLGEVAA